MNNAQEHSNQNFDQALIDQDHDDYDRDSSFEDLEGDLLAITRGIRNQIPLIPPGNQTFEQLPFGLAHAPRDLPQIIQRQANDILRIPLQMLINAESLQSLHPIFAEILVHKVRQFLTSRKFETPLNITCNQGQPSNGN